MQNNAATIEELGIIAEIVYGDDYFLETNPDTVVDHNDNDGLENSYTVLATSDMPSGFQGMLLENNGKYVFAFRGTETESGVLELWRDLAITDIRDMGTGTAPQQMKDAMSFVHEVMNDAGLDLTLNATNTTFTGHSLGGSLASMASYVYGFDAYTYNGFGINNMLWDADDTGAVDHPNEMTPDEFGMSDTYQTLGEHLESLGVTVQGTTNKTNNIIHVGYSRSDLVGGILTDIISGQTGDTHFVVNHTGNSGGLPAAWLDNHDKAKLNESIAIYNNILTLFPDQNYNSLTEILTPISPEDQKVEHFLTTLTELTNVASNADHVVWSENIAQSGTTNLALTGLGESDIAALENLTGSMSEMYALLNLNPFVIEGADYNPLNVDGYLEKETYSEQFIEDRAAFLFYSMPENTNPNSIRYEQRGENRADDFVIPDNDQSIPSNYIFGTKENDDITGDVNEDHLYGMGGNDVEEGNWRKAA